MDKIMTVKYGYRYKKKKKNTPYTKSYIYKKSK